MKAQPFSPVGNIKLIYRFHANVELQLILLEQKDIMLNSMTQTGENGTPLFWAEVTFEWYEHAMVFCVFIFIFMFRNVIREQLGQNNFSRCYVFFSKVTFRKYLITTMFKVLYQQLRSTLTDDGIWKTPYNGRFYGHRCQACSKTFNLLLYASLSLKLA